MGNFQAGNFAGLQFLLDGIEKILWRKTEIVVEGNPMTEEVALFVFKPEDEIEPSAQYLAFFGLEFGCSHSQSCCEHHGVRRICLQPETVVGISATTIWKNQADQKTRPASLVLVAHSGSDALWDSHAPTIDGKDAP